MNFVSPNLKNRPFIENDTEIQTKPSVAEVFPPTIESADKSDKFSSTSHQQRGCETLIEFESITVDFQPKTPMNFSNSECGIESDDYQAFDDYLDANTESNNSVRVPNQIYRQPDDDIKPSKKKQKCRNKIDANDKTKQSNGKPSNKLYPCEECNRTFRCTTNLKKHQHQHTGVRPFKCSLCSKS